MRKRWLYVLLTLLIIAACAVAVMLPSVALAHHTTLEKIVTCANYSVNADFYGGGEGGTPRKAVVEKAGVVVLQQEFDGKSNVANFYTDAGNLPANVIYEVTLYQKDAQGQFTVQVDYDTVTVNVGYTCTQTSTATATRTATATNTPTWTSSPTNTPTWTSSPTLTPTHTPSLTPTPTVTPTPTWTPTPTYTSVPSATPTPTNTPVPTTVTPPPTSTGTVTQSATTPTPTLAPPTKTEENPPASTSTPTTTPSPSQPAATETEPPADCENSFTLVVWVFGENGQKLTGFGNRLYAVVSTVYTKDGVVLGNAGLVIMPLFDEGHAQTGWNEEGRMVSTVLLYEGVDGVLGNLVAANPRVLHNETLEPLDESFPIGAHCGLKTVGLYLGPPPQIPPENPPPTNTGGGYQEAIMVAAGIGFLLLVAALFGFAAWNTIRRARRQGER